MAAHQEEDRVQDSAADFQMHARLCSSIPEGIASQTSQYKDSKIKHLELTTDTTHLSEKVW